LERFSRQKPQKEIKRKFILQKDIKGAPPEWGCIDEPVDKPGSVENGHSSATLVTKCL
jgi:hypothetical protein